MASADQAYYFKQAIKGIAAKYNVKATFISKRIKEEDGNGCHINMSLWSNDQQKDLFTDRTKKNNMSDVACKFVAGILKHAESICAITCPTVNC